jgi:hypothetical protein
MPRPEHAHDQVQDPDYLPLPAAGVLLRWPARPTAEPARAARQEGAVRLPEWMAGGAWPPRGDSRCARS